MNSHRSTVLPWDKSYITLGKDLTILCKEDTQRLLLGFEGGSILSLDAAIDFVLELVQILKCGPMKMKDLKMNVKAGLTKSLEFSQLIHELVDAGILESHNEINSLSHLHYLTDDQIFRDKEILKSTNRNLNIKRVPLPEVVRQKFRTSSIRKFSGKSLSQLNLASVLTHSIGFQDQSEGKDIAEKVHPSAGGLYGVKAAVLVQNVEGLSKGMYFYDEKAHQLNCSKEEQVPFYELFTTQHVDYASCAFVIIYFCDLSSYLWRYGKRGYRFALIEAGHCAQGLLLQSREQKISCVPVGAHQEIKLQKYSSMGENISYLYSVVCGK